MVSRGASAAARGVRDAARGSRGFTLVESLIALVLSSIVVLLVLNTFLVQNRHQARQSLSAAVHDNARAATELIARELRHAVPDGIGVAGARTLTVRAPVVVATVCARTGIGPIVTQVDVQSEQGQAAPGLTSIAGVGLWQGGSWDLRTTSWSTVSTGTSGSAQRCASNGTDTIGAFGDFHRLSGLYFGLTYGFANMPDLGEPVLLFRETTFTIRPSQLESGTLGLFRREGTGTPVEFATGLDTSARFAYRTGGTTYADTVVVGALGDIDAVRIVLDARRPTGTGPGQDVTFGWAVNVPLRNAP